jgi:hypothetical protein
LEKLLRASGYSGVRREDDEEWNLERHEGMKIFYIEND